ncbi:EAL domain-containing protein [Paraneptunicella aestuarii]|uniref:EAL domain-containing protein n=1 Tax=Paraneptunicella aestuarii TaxID=2831148 RepID=UPI001E55F391|nr:EAL domain-containing protein [Paraneptunicella aestuarii]UAA37884.1 EAL domain-containing protein [Paraneptunicella aestuarii]
MSISLLGLRKAIPLLAAFLLSLQVSIACASQDFSQYLTRLSPSEGLSQSDVTKTLQDKEGFIWIATQMGLNRFDGYDVKQVKGPNNIFEKEAISTLFLDNEGYLWVSTGLSGLYRLNTSTFETEKFTNLENSPGRLQSTDVSAITQSDDNTLWLGIANGVQRLDIANKSFTRFEIIESNDDYVRELLLKDDILYIATTNGLFTLDTLNNEVQPLNHLPAGFKNRDSNNTKMLQHCKELGLLVGTVEGLFRIKINGRKDYSAPELLIADLNIWDIDKTGDKYYIATNQGLFLFDTKTHHIQFLLNFSSSRYRTADDNILDLYRDDTGNLWLASRSQGVLVWSDISTRFSHVTTRTMPHISNENVWNIHEDNDGMIWIATNNGLNRYDINNNTVQSYIVNPDKKAVSGRQVIRNIYPDSQDDNLLWIDNDEGLFNFNKTTGELSRPFMQDYARTIVEENWTLGTYIQNNEHIYFFSQNNYYHFNAISGEIKPLPQLAEQVNPALGVAFLSALPNRENTVLLSASGQLFEYNLKTEEAKLIYQVKNYQPHAFDYVDRWLVDKQGVLWLAVAGEGLIGLDSNTYEELYRFNNSNLLLTSHVYALQMDEFNNIWFSSQSGLYRLHEDRNHIETYIAEDGLLSSEFNGSSSLKLKDGRMIFGSPLGITILSPSDFQLDNTSTQEYKVVLSDISLLSDGNTKKTFINGANIVLNHDQYGLKLQFSTLEYIQQNRTQYAIQLKGPVSMEFNNYNSNEFMLPKLQPGEYQLLVTADHPIHDTQSTPLLMQIKVNYSPWNSPGAKISYLLVIGSALLIFFMKRREKQLELLKMHQETNESRKQMQMALYGTNSGIWDYHIHNDTLYEERVAKDLGYSDLKGAITIQDHTQLLKPEHYRQIKPLWLDFLGSHKTEWDATYQMRAQNGNWLWYRDVGRVVEWDEDGKPARIIGTYTNITETKANQEQAKLFGEAFSQINDWVLILDAKLNPITANEAFMKVFDLTRENTQQTLKQLLTRLGGQKYQEFKEILKSLNPRESWQGEEVLETPSNEKHPVLIKINAIARQNSIISHYVIVISDITNQKHAEEKLRHLAHYDYLTDLPNRQLLFEKIEAKIRRSQMPFAVLFIDLDKFKQVNDLYGHFVGDNLLKHVSSLLLDCVATKDIVARQSGDEFIVLINEMTDINEVSQTAQKILHELSKTIVLGDLHVNITSSVGIATYPEDSDDANELIKKADLAMIHAKKAGRGEFQFFTQDMNEKAHRRITLENDLKDACRQNQFMNYYQPIINSRENRMVGVELLMRWQNKDEMVPPSIFIPIAEEIGLISQMTINAIDTALDDYATYFSQYPDFYVSINLSPVHILQEGLSETLVGLLHIHNLPSNVLRLEITETTLLADLDIALKRLKELRDLGFKLLLDDFGTGYSSMGYLSKFSIDYIKIDRSFINDLENNTNRSIVNSIITLAKNLGLNCIVEGVENRAQLRYVESLGCELIQGYLYSKPLPVKEIAQIPFAKTSVTELS